MFHLGSKPTAFVGSGRFPGSFSPPTPGRKEHRGAESAFSAPQAMGVFGQGQSAYREWAGEWFCFQNKSHSILFSVALCLRSPSDMHDQRKEGALEVITKPTGGFPGDLVTRNPPSNTEALGSVPGQGTRIPYVLGHLSPCAAARELRYCN